MNKKIENKRKQNKIQILCLVCISISLLSIIFSATTFIIINSRLKKVENVLEYYGLINDEPKKEENQSISEEIIEDTVNENAVEISDNNSSELEYVSEKINGIVFEYPKKGTVGEKGYFDEYGLEYYLEIEELSVMTKNGKDYYLNFNGTNFYDSSPDISIEAYNNLGNVHDMGAVYINTPCGEYTEITALIRDINPDYAKKYRITIKP